MLDHPRQRYGDQTKTGKILSEFDRSPIQFILNVAQILVLVGGIFLISFRMGVFRTEFTYLQSTVTALAATVANGFDVQAKENEKIKNAIIEHTGKPIP